MGKSNPHGLKCLLVVVISRLNEPGVKEVASLSKGKTLWKKSTKFFWIRASQESLLSEKVGFPLGKDWLNLLSLLPLNRQKMFFHEYGLSRRSYLFPGLPSSTPVSSSSAEKRTTMQDGASQLRAVQAHGTQICSL